MESMLKKTHPAEMDGETTLKQHDNVHRQISAFEKLLQHAINKFSREKLYGMLKILTKDFSREYTPGEHVYSMAHLKRMVSELETSKPGQDGKTLSRETEKHVVKYFKTFFEDVEYLKELKKYFDEKIYICLYEYYYDPLDDIQESELESLLGRYKAEDDQLKESARDLQKDDSGDSKKVGFHEDITEVYTGDRKEEEIVFDFLSAKGKLSHAVRQMFKVNEKWGNILNETDPHMEAYDPDSKHELLVFNDYVKYEAVLRLVPDVFVKAYKSVELGKLWWTQANKMYPNSPRKRRTVKDLHRDTGELSQKIIHVTEDIQRFEAAVLSRENELDELIKRESRFHILNDQCEKLEDKKDDVTHMYKTIMDEMNHLKQELTVLEKGTKKYTELEKRLKEKDKKLALTEDELKVLAYHFKIVQEDFNLELELRPHLIRFRADIEEKITELKQDIKDKIGAKRKTEKLLVLLKTNCDRMKQIMQKLNLVNEDDDEEMTDNLATPEKEQSKPEARYNKGQVNVAKNTEKDKEKNKPSSIPKQTPPLDTRLKTSNKKIQKIPTATANRSSRQPINSK